MSEIRQLQALRIATLLSFLLAIINHLLPPKAFAATQLLFDYEFGLVRRGLAGEVLNLFAGPQISVSEIFLAAALLSLAGALVFYGFLAHLMDRRRSSYLILILALNSFAYASFVGNSGYLDGALLVIAVIALAVSGRTSLGLGLRAGLVVLGVLTHENMLPYFAILIGFDLWLARAGDKFRVWVALSPVLVGIVTVAMLAIFAENTPLEAVNYAQYLQSKAGFQLDPNSTDVAGRTIGQNLALMTDLRGTLKYWTWVLFDGVPLFAMSLWLLWLAGRISGDALSVPGQIIMAAAIFAPLSLNFIAFDVVRFGVASVLSGFLVLGLLVRHLPEAADRLERVLSWPHFLILLVLNANIFTIQVNIGGGHVSQFPWVLLTQMNWLTN